MATLTVTNPGSTDIYVADLYCTVKAGASVSTTRYNADLTKMAGLHGLVQAGSLTVTVAYSAAEIASGLVDVGPTAASSTSGTVGDENVVRFALTAGGGGSADDVTLYALGALPYKKMRIVDAWAMISAGAAGGRTIGVRTATGGAGTLCAEVSAAATGRGGQTATVTASSAITSGASVGLFARRSDSAIAGELFVAIRPEK